MSTEPGAALLWAARHDRAIVIAGIAAVTVGGLWSTLALGDRLMRDTAPAADTLAYAALLFLMWWTMMMAMMLPSAAPAIIGFGTISRKMPGHGALALPAFAAGYAALWTAFSLAAVLLQLGFAKAVPLTGMMAMTSRVLGGALLIGAGLYQFSPLKQACLRNCQPPFFWLARHWRKGVGGAFRMGLAHGATCLGCCWMLMLLLFYGGVMELNWIIGLALYVAIEKFMPAGSRLSWLTGAALIAWGAVVLWRAIG